MKRYGVRWLVAGCGYALSGPGCACGWRGAATHEAVQVALASGGVRLRTKRYRVRWQVAGCASGWRGARAGG